MASQWTIDTLKEHYDQRFDDVKEAVNKASGSMDRRLDLLNEFRAQQADESRKYAQSELVNQQFKEFDGRLNRTENSVASLQGRALALVAIGAIVGAIASAVISKWIT